MGNFRDFLNESVKLKVNTELKQLIGLFTDVKTFLKLANTEKLTQDEVDDIEYMEDKLNTWDEAGSLKGSTISKSGKDNVKSLGKLVRDKVEFDGYDANGRQLFISLKNDEIEYTIDADNVVYKHDGSVNKKIGKLK